MVGAVALVLIGASALDVRLGLPTFICGLITAAAVLALSRQSPWPIVKRISWSVIPLVAGLFVMVEALIRIGVSGSLSCCGLPTDWYSAKGLAFWPIFGQTRFRL